MAQASKIQTVDCADWTVLGSGITEVIRVGIGANKSIVVKRLNPNHMNDADHVSSFRQEIEITHRLRHPNVVRVLECRFDPSGAPLMIMEFMRGVTLANFLCGKQTVKLKGLLEVFTQVLAALGHIHSQGVLHLDVKPENVFLFQQKSKKIVTKLMDFGISQYLSDCNKDCFSKTERFAGTPAYMSPEQCSRNELSPASDIYSMGCLMYECLTGVPPFQAESGFATMFQHLRQPAPAFSSICPDHNLPGWLEAIVLRALEKDPKDRFQSTNEMRKELTEAMQQEATDTIWLKRIINIQTNQTLYDCVAAREVRDKTTL